MTSCTNIALIVRTSIPYRINVKGNGGFISAGLPLSINMYLTQPVLCGGVMLRTKSREAVILAWDFGLKNNTFWLRCDMSKDNAKRP